LIGFWIAEETTLMVMVKDLGVEVRLVAGRTILTSLNSLYFHGRVEGLCGNMDSEYFNDFTTPDRIVVTNPQLFGLTWLICVFVNSALKIQCHVVTLLQTAFSAIFPLGFILREEAKSN